MPSHAYAIVCPSSHESQEDQGEEANRSKICHGQAPLDFARARGTKCLSDPSLAAYAIYLLLSSFVCFTLPTSSFSLLHLHSFTALLNFLFCEHLRHGSLEVDSLAARDRWQIPWRQTWKLSLVPLRVARGKWKKRFQIFHDISASNVRLTDDLTASHPAWEP